MTDMSSWTKEEKQRYTALLKTIAQHERLSEDQLRGLSHNVAKALVEVCRDSISR